MRKSLIAVVAACLFALVSCQQGTQPQMAAPTHPMTAHSTTQNNYPLNFTLWNSCCNEYVTITGNEHFTYSSDYTNFHVNTSGLTGTGTSGSTYHGSLTENETVNYTNGATEYSVVEHFTMSSADGCKFKLTYKYHVTFNANGDMTVDNFDYSTECF